MKFSTEIPPIYERIKQVFPVDWNDGLVITYGDTVYSKGKISPDLEAHESAHIVQQARYEGGAEAWWERYFVDVEFRKKQEVEAYKIQILFIRQHVKDRNAQARLIHHIHSSMARMYNMCTYNEAKELTKI